MVGRGTGLPSGTVTFVFTDIEGSTHLVRNLGDRYTSALDRHRDDSPRRRGIGTVATRSTPRVTRSSLPSLLQPTRSLPAQRGNERSGSNRGHPEHLCASGWASTPVSRFLMNTTTWRSPCIRLRAWWTPVTAARSSCRQTRRMASSCHRCSRCGHSAGFASATSTTRSSSGSCAARASTTRFRLCGCCRLIATTWALRTPRSSDRDAELERLAEMTSPSKATTLVGPGGVGKTRLATEHGLRSLDAWPDGVWFVDLAVLNDGGLVPAAIAGDTRCAHVRRLRRSSRDRQPPCRQTRAAHPRQHRARSRSHRTGGGTNPRGAARMLGSSAPAVNHSVGEQRRSYDSGHCPGTGTSTPMELLKLRCSCSSSGPPRPVRRGSTTWRPSRSSAGDSTGCRWRSRWPLPERAC